MIEPFYGEIMWFAGNYPPRGFLACDGRLLNIASYTGLYALLGTAYGGDGVTTFALPDLRGVHPLGVFNAVGTDATGGTVPTDESGPQLPGTVSMTACLAVAGIYPPRRY